KAGGNLRIGANGRAVAAGPLNATTDRDLLVDGTLGSRSNVTAHAARDLLVSGSLTSVDGMMLNIAHTARVTGTVASENRLDLAAKRLTIDGNGVAQAGTSLTVSVDDDAMIVGRALAAQDLKINAGKHLQIDGTVAAV